MKMDISDKHKDSSLDNLEQIFLFKSMDEAEGFVSSNFDLAGEYDDDGVFKILNKDAFEMREITTKKNKTISKKMNNSATTDDEAKELVVGAHNEKLITSRARNSYIDGNKSANKANNLYWLDNKVKELLGGEKVGKYEIATLLSEAVTQSGSSAILKTDADSILNFQKEVLDRMGHKVYRHEDIEGNRLLEQTINNIVNSYDNLIENRNVYEPILAELYSNESFKQAPDSVKDVIFKNVKNTVIGEHANTYYGGNEGKKRAKLVGGKNRRVTTSEIKDLYEIDLSNLAGISNNLSYVSEISQDGAENIVKLDLGKNNAEFNAINKVLKTLRPHEDMHESVKVDYAREAVVQVMTSISNSRNNKPLHSNKYYQDVRKVISSDKEAGKYTFDPYLQMTNLLKGMKQTKKKNPNAGLVSKDMSMSTLTVDKDFTSSLVKALAPDAKDGIDLKQVISNVINTTDITDVSLFKEQEKATANWVTKNVLSNIMPDRDKYLSIVNSTTKDKKAITTVTNLYDITNKFIQDLYSDVVGANIGAGFDVKFDSKTGLYVINGNEVAPIKNMPRIVLDEDTGTLGFKIGNSNQVFSLETDMIFDIKNGVPQVKSVSNLESSFNEVYKNGSSYTQRTIRKINRKEKLDIKDMERIVTSRSKFMRENSVLDSFNPSQLHNNYRVNISDISSIITNLFGTSETDNAEYIINSLGSIGNDLKSNMKALIGTNTTYENLPPLIAQSLAANAQQIAVGLAQEGSKEKEILKNFNFSGKDKLVAGYVGHSSEKVTTQAVGVLNDNKRQLEAQTANFTYIREKQLDDLIEKTKNNITPVYKKSFITTDSAETKQSLHIKDIGDVSSGATLKMGYVSTDAMAIMINNTVENNANQQTLKMFEGVRERLNTFEQQRFMDARIYEGAYGQVPDRVQKLGTSQDIVKAIKSSSKDNLGAYSDVLDMIGNVDLDSDGNIVFKSGKKKIVKRGEAIFDYAGFGNNESFTSKIDEGILGYSFFKKKDLAMNDEEVSSILNKYKNRFLDKDNKLITNKITTNNIINKIMSEQDFIVGQYNITSTEKMSLDKITSDTGEKGMTKVLYSKTGKYDNNISSLLTAINKQEVVGNRSITNDAMKLYLEEHTGGNTKKLNKLLKEHNFSDVNSVLEALTKESFTENNAIFDDMFKGQLHIVGNDALAKHGNKGMVMQAQLNNLTANIAKYEDISMDEALNKVQAKINSDLDKYSFIEKDGQKTIGFTNKDGRVMLDRALKQDEDSYDNINIAGLKNLIKDLDTDLSSKYNVSKEDRMYHKSINMYGIEGTQEDVIGQFMFNGKEALIPKAYHNTNRAIDPETQTSYTQEYINMNRRKIALERKQKIGGIDSLSVSEAQELESLKYQVSAAKSTMKRMKVGDQELRIWNDNIITEDVITRAHSMQKSLDINISPLLDSLDSSLIGQKPLGAIANRALNNLFFNPDDDMLLTPELIQGIKNSYNGND